LPKTSGDGDDGAAIYNVVVQDSKDGGGGDVNLKVALYKTRRSGCGIDLKVDGGDGDDGDAHCSRLGGAAMLT